MTDIVCALKSGDTGIDTSEHPLVRYGAHTGLVNQSLAEIILLFVSPEKRFDKNLIDKDTCFSSCTAEIKRALEHVEHEVIKAVKHGTFLLL